MSGVKGRSGRRPDAERKRCREQIQSAISDDDWKLIFQQMATRAKEGSVAHAKLLLGYMYGQPSDIAAEQDEPLPISIIRIREPCPNCGHAARRVDPLEASRQEKESVS